MVFLRAQPLWTIHHAAYDSFILSVTPDYEIVVRGDILEEIDGPLLQHGLKELHQTQLTLPNERRNWPNRESLEWQYSRFLEAA